MTAAYFLISIYTHTVTNLPPTKPHTNRNPTSPPTEMKLITAAIYTNYTTHVVDDEGIEQKDAYTAPPEGNRLVLGFERVGSGV